MGAHPDQFGVPSKCNPGHQVCINKGARCGGRLAALKAVNHILPLIVLSVILLTGNAPGK